MKLFSIGTAFGAFLTVMVTASAPSMAFNKGVEEESGDAGFKEVLRQREMERDSSRKNLEKRDRERKERQGKGRAHIHAVGDDPTAADGSEVVATFELSKEEYEKRDFSRVHATARAQNRLSRVIGTAEAAASPAPGSTATVPNRPLASNRTLLGLSLLLVAGGAWWVMRPRETA